MARPIVQRPVDAYCTYFEFAGSSSETKPTERVATGSMFFEVDTKTVYAYDEESAEWVVQFTFGGGDE